MACGINHKGSKPKGEGKIEASKPELATFTKQQKQTSYTNKNKHLVLERLTEALIFSNSFSLFCWSCLWSAWFSSDILILLARIWDCTRARVCMHLNVVVACLLTDWPCISVFNLTNPLKARRALLAWKSQTTNIHLLHTAHFSIMGLFDNNDARSLFTAFLN